MKRIFYVTIVLFLFACSGETGRINEWTIEVICTSGTASGGYLKTGNHYIGDGLTVEAGDTSNFDFTVLKGDNISFYLEPEYENDSDVTVATMTVSNSEDDIITTLSINADNVLDEYETIIK